MERAFRRRARRAVVRELRYWSRLWVCLSESSPTCAPAALEKITTSLGPQLDRAGPYSGQGLVVAGIGNDKQAETAFASASSPSLLNVLRHQGGLVRGLTRGLRKRKERLVYWMVLSGKHSCGYGRRGERRKAYLCVILCGLERTKDRGRRLRFEDRPTDIKRVAFPPKSDNHAVRHERRGLPLAAAALRGRAACISDRT
jgi:hypothetical protein